MGESVMLSAEQRIVKSKEIVQNIQLMEQSIKKSRAELDRVLNLQQMLHKDLKDSINTAGQINRSSPSFAYEYSRIVGMAKKYIDDAVDRLKDDYNKADFELKNKRREKDKYTVRYNR